MHDLFLLLVSIYVDQKRFLENPPEMDIDKFRDFRVVTESIIAVQQEKKGKIFFLFIFSTIISLDQQIVLYDINLRKRIAPIPETKGTTCFCIGAVKNPLGRKIPTEGKSIVMAVGLEKGFFLFSLISSSFCFKSSSYTRR